MVWPNVVQEDRLWLMRLVLDDEIVDRAVNGQGHKAKVF